MCRLGAGTAVPAAVWGDGLVAVVQTADELSVVCPADRAPAGAAVEPGWTVYTVDGPLDFALTGVLASLTAALAAVGVPVFAVSSYDTDHLLVREADAPAAERAWAAAGHRIA
ncbi:MAG: hypothetical protein JWN54_3720 [Mycobacterium sp.]|nr:hypothetical protein [Mycobacterium sp.]